MALFVVAFPRFSAEHRAWIDALRVDHDAEMHRRIAPHVTLLFGTDRLAEGELVAHAREAVCGIPPFECAFNCARAIRDTLSPSSHVFLIPHLGSGELVTLHDRLYQGPMTSELRRDVAFVPHVTVASKDRFEDAERLTNDLAGARFDVKGLVDELEVLRLEAGVVVSKTSVPLEGQAA